jgi:hypothetical protein
MSSFVRCPDCDSKVYPQDEQPGDKLRCEECGRRFTWFEDGEAKDRPARRRHRDGGAAERIRTGIRQIRRRRARTPWYLFPLAGLPLLAPPGVWVAGLISGASFAPLGYIAIALGLILPLVCLVLALLPWSLLGRLIAIGTICFIGCAAGFGLAAYQLARSGGDPDSEWEMVENAWSLQVEMPKGAKQTNENMHIEPRTMVAHKISVTLPRQNLDMALMWADPPYFDAQSDDVVLDIISKELAGRGTMMSTNRTFIEGHRVCNFHVRLSTGSGWELQRFYIARRLGKVRFFRLTVVGPNVQPDCPEAKRFFDSFHPGEF